MLKAGKALIYQLFTVIKSKNVDKKGVHNPPRHVMIITAGGEHISTPLTAWRRTCAMVYIGAITAAAAATKVLGYKRESS